MFLTNCVTYLEIKLQCKILIIEYMEPHLRYAFVSVSGVIYTMKLTISIEKTYNSTLNDTSSPQFWNLKKSVEMEVFFLWDMVSSYIRDHLSIFDRHVVVILDLIKLGMHRGISRMVFKERQRTIFCQNCIMILNDYLS